jgi:peptidoglycan/LPS O-acetylase OafA/YrhL
MKYRSDIDGLRSLAVVPVVLNHAGLSMVPGGFVGVDIFFVISGFLITRIIAGEIDEGRFSIVGFYERRVRRILPALIAMMLACFAVGWFILLPSEYADLSKSALATLLFSSNIWFWRVAADYFSDSVATAPLLHTWSLAVEEQFYLFFPLLLSFMAARLRRSWGWVIAAISLASLLLSIVITGTHPTANFYLLPSRIWELGLGALIAIGAIPASASRPLNNAASVAGIAAILLSILLIDETMPFPGLGAVPPCLGAAAIIWSGQQQETAGGKLLSASILVWFGLISYSLYLWHWPVIVAARIVSGDLILDLPTAIICIVLSVILGWLSWRYIERPFRHTRTGFWASRARIFQGAGIAMASVALLSGVVFIQGGFSGRMPQAANAMLVEASHRSVLEQECMSRVIGKPPCRLGSGEAPVSLVVWGDSHAGAMLSGFDDFLSRSGRAAVAFTKSACPPLPGLWRADMGINHRCDAHNADALKQIDASFPGAPVILVARWALATQSERAPGEAGGKVVLARSGEQPRALDDNAALVEEKLNLLASHFESQGRKVVILTGVPEQGRDVPRAVARLALLGQNGQDVAQGFVSRADYYRRNDTITPIFNRLKSHHDVRVIDLGGIYCREVCMAFKDGKPLYRDDDHLSNFGAHWLIEKIFPAFRG